MQVERIERMAALTTGLAVAGGIAGSVTSVAMMLALMVNMGEFPPMGIFLLGAGGVVGGIMGAVLGPPAAWLLLRHVPLGRAIGGTAVGTFLSSVLWLMVIGESAFPLGALAGFILSAVAVRYTAPRPPSRPLLSRFSRASRMLPG